MPELTRWKFHSGSEEIEDVYLEEEPIDTEKRRVAATIEGPVRGHVEYSRLDNGFYALFRSPVKLQKLVFQRVVVHRALLSWCSDTRC